MPIWIKCDLYLKVLLILLQKRCMALISQIGINVRWLGRYTDSTEDGGKAQFTRVLLLD